MKNVFGILFVVLFLSACSRESGELPESAQVEKVERKPVVYVVNYPLKYFTERVGGDLVDVILPVPGNEDPAFWKPGEKEIVGFQQADLILVNGANYAKWLSFVSLPENTQRNTLEGLSERFIRSEGVASHSHGTEGEHSHEGIAFTTWLDFELASLQANAIKNYLIDLMPDRKMKLEANYLRLRNELNSLDMRMLMLGGKLKELTFVTSHPVYQYLSRRYGIEMRSLLWEPELVPDKEALGDLRALLKERSSQWMIWEGEPASESVKILEGLGLQSIVFDPCSNVREGKDWLQVMDQNLENLRQAFP